MSLESDRLDTYRCDKAGCTEKVTVPHTPFMPEGWVYFTFQAGALFWTPVFHLCPHHAGRVMEFADWMKEKAT